MIVTIVGVDLAKSVFQVHGTDPDGHVVLRRRLARGQLLAFFAKLPPWVLSGLAPPPLADEGWVGYRAAPHGGGRECSAWNVGRRQ